jgi:hypothetical protein
MLLFMCGVVAAHHYSIRVGSRAGPVDLVRFKGTCEQTCTIDN